MNRQARSRYRHDLVPVLAYQRRVSVSLKFENCICYFNENGFNVFDLSRGSHIDVEGLGLKPNGESPIAHTNWWKFWQ